MKLNFEFKRWFTTDHYKKRMKATRKLHRLVPKISEYSKELKKKLHYLRSIKDLALRIMSVEMFLQLLRSQESSHT